MTDLLVLVLELESLSGEVLLEELPLLAAPTLALDVLVLGRLVLALGEGQHEVDAPLPVPEEHRLPLLVQLLKQRRDSGQLKLTGCVRKFLSLELANP